MTDEGPSENGRLSRDALRAELESVHLRIADLEVDRWRSHERLLDSLAENLQDGFALLSPQGVHLDVNPALCTMVGYAREELVGTGLPHPYWPPEDREGMENDLLRHIAGATNAVETTFMRKDGERFPALVTPSAIRDEDDQPICIFAIIRDIGEQKRAEEELRLSEARYARAQEVGRVGSWEYDPLTASFRGSSEARRIYGLDPDTPTFSTEEVEATTPDRERVHQALVDLIAEGKEFDLEYEILPKGSLEPRFVWSVAEVQRDERGGPLVVTGVVQDITERKRADDAGRESEARYRSLFEDSPVAMWEDDYSVVKAHLEELAGSVGNVIAHVLADPREYARCIELCREVDANRAAVRLFEAESQEELLARNSELYRRDSDRGIYRLWAAMLAGERSVTFEEANLSLKGKELHILETCTVVPGHEQTFDRVYVADVDITDRKRAEEALREREERSRRALGATVAALGATVAMRDPYTASHERRVSELACLIAERLGWGEEAIEALRMAALVHDVGKIAVPVEILSKPTRLTETEFELVKGHAAAAYEILAPIDFGGPVAEIVAQHHERLDGSGYPAGLRGDEICPGGRVLAVADVVEAMITHRPYRPALPLEEALAEIGPDSRGRFDAEAAEACRKLFVEEGFTLPE